MNVIGQPFRCCDRIPRRSFLKAGFLGLGGLGLADVLRLRAAAAESSGQPPSDTSVIMIWLGGGPSHIDTYDMKPAAPSEFRGMFAPSKTNVPGIEINPLMSRQAKVMDKIAVIRSITHDHAGHEGGTHWLQTGYRPANPLPLNNERPSLGSIVNRVRGANRPAMPGYVALPNTLFSGYAAYLGVANNPFTTQADPNQMDFRVRNLNLPGGVDLARLQERKGLLQTFDRVRSDAEASGLLDGLDSFGRNAFEMVTGSAARQAFDINQEPPRLRDKYGRHTWGQNCLLARRLVEAGVGVVTIDMGGWDHHAGIQKALETSLPPYDLAIAALVDDISQRGLDRNVMVVVCGEFGRTPMVNKGAGRDHWPGAMFALMSGGGVKGGQTIGSTNSKGEIPKDRPLSPQDLLATVYRFMGIDTELEFTDSMGRPVRILSGGEPIHELI